MPPGEFLYLLGGMLDLIAPEATEPAAEKVARKVREIVSASTAASIGRRRRTGSW